MARSGNWFGWTKTAKKPTELRPEVALARAKSKPQVSASKIDNLFACSRH